MATGTGKTRTTMALIDLLLRARQAQKVLFLADRDALVEQALNDGFKAHLPDSAPVNLVTERTAEGRVFLSTYPTMMNLIDGRQDEKAKFGPPFEDAGGFIYQGLCRGDVMQCQVAFGQLNSRVYRDMGQRVGEAGAEVLGLGQFRTGTWQVEGSAHWAPRSVSMRPPVGGRRWPPGVARHRPFPHAFPSMVS